MSSPILQASPLSGGISYYTIQGGFTGQQAMTEKEVLVQLVAGGQQTLVLDMWSVTDADIVGVNTLVQLHRVLSSRGGQLEIRLQRNGRLDQLLHLTKMGQWFRLVYNRT